MVRRVTQRSLAAQSGWETGPNCPVREFSHGDCVLPNLHYGVQKRLSMFKVTGARARAGKRARLIFCPFRYAALSKVSV